MAEAPEGPKDQGLESLFDLVTRHVPSPRVAEGPFRMIGTILEADPFFGTNYYRSYSFRLSKAQSKC